MKLEIPNISWRRVGGWAVACVALMSLARPMTAAPAQYPQSTSRFAIADFDGDSRPDFASVQVGQTGLRDTRYSIAFQLSGGFGHTVSLTAPTGGLQIIARDVNGDNFLDVIVTTAWTHKPVAVLLNDGVGNFTASNPSEFVGAFVTSEAALTAASDDVRDATALLDSRSAPDACGRQAGAVSGSSLRGRLSSTPCDVLTSPGVSPFAGRAPPLLTRQ